MCALRLHQLDCNKVKTAVLRRGLLKTSWTFPVNITLPSSCILITLHVQPVCIDVYGNTEDLLALAGIVDNSPQSIVGKLERIICNSFDRSFTDSRSYAAVVEQENIEKLRIAFEEVSGSFSLWLIVKEYRVTSLEYSICFSNV